MSTLANLFLPLWFLAFLSPVGAIICAVLFYRDHCRRRPRPERRFPAVAYVVVLLVCAVIAFPFGMGFGIDVACSDPTFGNLCGLFGVFVTGPLASSFAVFFVGGLVMFLPADAPIPADEASVPIDEARRPVRQANERRGLAAVYLKLWRGEYSLASSFWGFFILGILVAVIIRMNPVFLFLPGALVFQLVMLGYEITAAVGVWRSANALLTMRGGRASATYADTMKVIAAKTIVVLLLGLPLLGPLRVLVFYLHP